MKTKKQFKRIILISVLIMLLISSVKTSSAFVAEAAAAAAASAGGFLGSLGIVAILITAIQYLALAFFAAIKILISVITGLAGDGSAGAIGDVVFNRCGLTSANFFNEVWVGPKLEDGTLLIVNHIRTYYTVLRNLSIAMLLGILLYIGIRMAISTVASEEAKYKKMLKDWVVSLVLVFVLHYIMIITFFINNVLVETLASTYNNSLAGDWSELWKSAVVPIKGFPYLIVYGAFITGTLAFVLMYVKRTIVLAFLIVIAPLITITYSIDKMGDGKSQALNNWMKEFIFTVIIQPFHCIIYLVFYQSIMETLNGQDFDLGKMIFAVASAFFMLKAENIVKKIFGIQPSSIGDAIGTGAMAINVATSMFKNKGKKIDKSKGKMPDMTKDNKNSENVDKGKKSAGGKQQVGDNQPEGENQQEGENGPVGGSKPEGASQSPEGNQSQLGVHRNTDGIKNVLDKLGKTKFAKRFERNGGFQGYKGRAISGAATLVGAIAGATVGDFKTTVSTGMALGGIASSKHDEHEYKKTEEQLETNQQVFAGAYEDFAATYRDNYGDVDDKEIMQAAKNIFEGGGQDILNDYEREFFDKMDQLSTSAEIMGYSNGFDYVKDTIRKTQMGVIEPKWNHQTKIHKKNNDE